MPANTYGRQVIVPLTNKSGGSVAAGDVVIIDTTNNEAFTTTTSGAFTGGIGIAQETIASNAVGRVLLEGYAALVNVNASVTRGNFGKTHTVVKQATDAGASRISGVFCQFLTGGTTPTARVWSPDIVGVASSVATDTIWDAAGDLAVGTGADTAHKLTAGASGTRLVSAGAADPVWTSFPKSIVRYTTGDISVTTTTIGTALAGPGDITIAAATGDYIEIGMSIRAVTPDATRTCRLDVGTVVSAAIVNYVSSLNGTAVGAGVSAWLLQNTTSPGQWHAGSPLLYVAQSGDITGGNIVLRMCAWLPGAGTYVLSGSTTAPLVFWAMNHRQ